MYIPRINESILFASFERPYVSALLGPRRVGKSTLVDHYRQLNSARKWVMLNMDKYHERLRVVNQELHKMIEEEALSRIGQTEKIWVIIDEAQKCPELFEQVKVIYDTYKGQNKIKFILTGSAHLDLHHFTVESLAGRVDLLNLREFNLREIALLIQQQITLPENTAFDFVFDSNELSNLQALFDSLRPFSKLLNQALDTHLIWGGLPEVLQESESNYRWKYISDYLQTYLEKDIRAIETIGDLTLYHNLMKICAEQTGSIRDDKKIIEALHCSRNTIIKYRGYLQATLQFAEIYPYINSSAKRLVKSPKGYLTNNGLISYLSGISESAILQTTGLIGHRFENWFLHELQTWWDKSSLHHAVYFWRTIAGGEVDFIAVHGNQVVPFEITYSSQIQNKKVKNLLSFMSTEPKAKIGIYIYRGDLLIDKENRLIFLPAWMI